MDSNDRKSRKRKSFGWGSRFLIGFVVAILLLLFLLVLYKNSLSNRIQTKLDAIRAQGYPATCVELDRWYTYPPAGENAADILTEAYGLIVEWNSERAETLPVVGEAELPGRGQPLPAEMMQVIQEYLTDNQRALALLHQGAALPQSRYPIDLAMGIDVLLPDLGKSRDGAKLLQLETYFQVENNQTDQALQSVQSIFGLARSFENEPILISQLVKIGCRALGTVTLEEVLNRTSLSPKQLQQVEDILDQALADDQGMKKGFIGERCWGQEFFSMPADQLSVVSGTGSAGLITVARVFGLSAREHSMYLDMMEDYIQAQEVPFPQRIETIHKMEQEVENKARRTFMLQQIFPALARTVVLEARHIAQLQTTRTALAVERYRLEQNQLPETLSDLVPKYLPEVPLDPFDGKPLRYKVLEKGFTVYSIGEDKTDNQGRELDKDGDRGRGQDNTDIIFIIER